MHCEPGTGNDLKLETVIIKLDHETLQKIARERRKKHLTKGSFLCWRHCGTWAANRFVTSETLPAQASRSLVDVVLRTSPATDSSTICCAYSISITQTVPDLPHPLIRVSAATLRTRT